MRLHGDENGFSGRYAATVSQDRSALCLTTHSDTTVYLHARQSFKLISAFFNFFRLVVPTSSSWYEPVESIWIWVCRGKTTSEHRGRIQAVAWNHDTYRRRAL